MLGCKEMTILG